MNARIFAVEDDAPTLTALKKYIEKLVYAVPTSTHSGGTHA